MRSLYVFTKNSNDPKAKYIKYCEILRKAIKEAKKQHYSRLIIKSNNKINTTWNITKKETGNVRSVKHVPTLLVNDEKLKDPTHMTTALNNFYNN